MLLGSGERGHWGQCDSLLFGWLKRFLLRKAGARFVSPFVGRLDDLSQDGMQLIHEIAEVYSNYPELKTEVLAASIRHPLHVAQAALAGADVSTIPYPVLKKLFNHPMTDSGNAKFTADWQTVENTDIIGQVDAWLERKWAWLNRVASWTRKP